MKIAVTGATGFIGKHLVKKLNRLPGVYLTLFDRKRHSLNKPSSLKPLVSGQDVIFHLAGVVRDTLVNEFKINSGGTLSLAEALRRHGKKKPKIVFASTYGIKRSTYGLSKLLAEEILRFYHKNYDISVIVLRLSNVYGPDASPEKHSVVSTFMARIKKDKNIIINGDGEQTRDFVYIEDVVSAFVQALKYKSDSMEIFEIASGRATSMNKLVKLLEKVSQRKARVKYKPNVAEEEKGFYKGNYKKAKKKLKWYPRTDLYAGLKLTWHEDSNSNS